MRHLPLLTRGDRTGTLPGADSGPGKGSGTQTQLLPELPHHLWVPVGVDGERAALVWRADVPFHAQGTGTCETAQEGADPQG